MTYDDHGAIRTTREEATQEDFEDNFEEALEARLPPQIHLETNLGGIL